MKMGHELRNKGDSEAHVIRQRAALAFYGRLRLALRRERKVEKHTVEEWDKD